MADFGNIAGLVKSFTQPLESDGVTPKTSVIWAKEKVAAGPEVTLMRYDFVAGQWVPLASEESVYKVDAATDVNSALTGITTVDNVGLVAGSKVLLWGQTTITENGIYESDGAGNLTRIPRYSTSVLGDHVIFVHNGDTHGDKVIMPKNLTNLDGFVIGSDPIEYKVVVDPNGIIQQVIAAAAGADGAITLVKIVGTSLQFTGTGTAFNGTIDLSSLVSSTKYTKTFASGDWSSETLTIPGTEHARGVNPIVQVIDSSTNNVVVMEEINIDPANGDIVLTIGVGLEFDGKVYIV